MVNAFLPTRNTLFFVSYSIHVCQIFTPGKSICSLYLPDGKWLAWMLLWQLQQQLKAHYTAFTSFPLLCSTPNMDNFPQSFCSSISPALAAENLLEEPLCQPCNIEYTSSLAVIVRLLWYLVLMPGHPCHCWNLVIFTGNFFVWFVSHLMCSALCTVPHSSLLRKYSLCLKFLLRLGASHYVRCSSSMPNLTLALDHLFGT